VKRDELELLEKVVQVLRAEGATAVLVSPRFYLRFRDGIEDTDFVAAVFNERNEMTFFRLFRSEQELREWLEEQKEKEASDDRNYRQS